MILEWKTGYKLYCVTWCALNVVNDKESAAIHWVFTWSQAQWQAVSVHFLIQLSQQQSHRHYHYSHFTA